MEFYHSGEKIKINGHEEVVLLDCGYRIYTIVSNEKEFSGIKIHDRQWGDNQEAGHEHV